MLTKYTQENENDRALIDSQTATPKANATWVPPPQGLATLSIDTAIDPVNNKSGLARILRNGNIWGNYSTSHNSLTLLWSTSSSRSKSSYYLPQVVP
uniref:Uncharacterized protein n=1 Tax=Cannabis sativa TaxID=3483 RepID=A0A803PL89_CANSA